jgi:hypothetical protein
VFADDLSAFKEFPEKTPNNNIMTSMKGCQAELHAWGEADQVTFESKKKHSILSSSEPFGERFKLLGVVFDTALSMKSAVQQLTQEAGWKLKMLIRTRRYYDIQELIVL